MSQAFSCSSIHTDSHSLCLKLIPTGVHQLSLSFRNRQYRCAETELRLCLVLRICCILHILKTEFALDYIFKSRISIFFFFLLNIEFASGLHIKSGIPGLLSCVGFAFSGHVLFGASQESWAGYWSTYANTWTYIHIHILTRSHRRMYILSDPLGRCYLTCWMMTILIVNTLINILSGDRLAVFCTE